MDKPEDVARVREIKRLLDRIQQLPLVAEGAEQAAAGRPAAAAYQQPWTGHADGSGGVQGGRGRSSVLSPWLFVLATALNTIVAAVLAVLITLGVVRQAPPADGPLVKGPAAAGQRPAEIAAVTAPPPAQPTQLMTLTRAIELEPIGAPDRPLRLQALKPAPLPLNIEPDEAQHETFILVLAGLPAGTSLSGAERMSSDSWLLPPDSLEKLEITVPEWSSVPIEVGVELRRTNGTVAARSKAWISVPPPQIPAAARPNPMEIKQVVERADRLLGRGDVVSARSLYERAAEMGSGQAALALGSTFDPNRLWSLGVFGMVGNKERARHWYLRADQLGHPEARARLRSLGD
jgi:hypothetical protein